jgi:50S ribosomal protein L16 3-hydroxylase
VRAALPGFAGPFTRASLCALAARDDVESRLVVREGKRWRVEHGPFARRVARAASRARVDAARPGREPRRRARRRADAALRVRALRAPRRPDGQLRGAGGGVGPHLDSYDVFLLQGFGRRRWRWGAQRDTRFVPGLPLKILARFAPTHDAVLAPGDMLYLPPHVAHDGVALDACTTYSIGFRAPAARELARRSSSTSPTRSRSTGRYADPGLARPRPARIPAAMQAGCARRSSASACRRATSTTSSARGSPSPSRTSCSRRATACRRRPRSRARSPRRGARLDLATQALYDARSLYVNGERVSGARADDGGAARPRRPPRARARRCREARPIDPRPPSRLVSPWLDPPRRLNRRPRPSSARWTRSPSRFRGSTS